MRVGLLADTHGFLDPAIFDYFSNCAEIWHSGDLGPFSLLAELEAFRPLRAVWGNIDGEKIRAALGRDLHWECEGLRIFMTHIQDARARAAITTHQPGLFICGHSHILKVERAAPSAMLHLNPGAAGHHGWHQERTILRFTLAAGKLSELEAIHLGPRGRRAAL